MLNSAIRRTHAAIVQDRRSEERFDVYLKTALFEGTAIGEPVILINMSTTGFLARATIKHRIGNDLSVYLPGLGQVAAVTRWSGNGLIGCEFRAPLDDGTFILLRDIMAKSDHGPV